MVFHEISGTTEKNETWCTARKLRGLWSQTLTKKLQSGSTILDPKTRIFLNFYSCLYATTTIPFLITIGDSFQLNGLDGARVMVVAVVEENEVVGDFPCRHMQTLFLKSQEYVLNIQQLYNHNFENTAIQIYNLF